MKLITTKSLAATLLMLGLAACSKTGPEVLPGADLSDKESILKAALRYL